MSDQAIVVSEKNGEAVAALLDLVGVQSRPPHASICGAPHRSGRQIWWMLSMQVSTEILRPTVPMETGGRCLMTAPIGSLGGVVRQLLPRSSCHPPLARWRRWDSDSVWNGRSFDSFLVCNVPCIVGGCQPP